MAKVIEQKTNKELAEKKAELFSLKLKLMSGEEKNTSKLGKLKKEIARLLTKANSENGKN